MKKIGVNSEVLNSEVPNGTEKAADCTSLLGSVDASSTQGSKSAAQNYSPLGVVKGISVSNINPDEALFLVDEISDSTEHSLYTPIDAKEENFAAEKVELNAVEVKENS